MKLLYVIVLLIAAFTADCQDSSEEHTDRNFADGEQHILDEFLGKDSADEARTITEELKGHNSVDEDQKFLKNPDDRSHTYENQDLKKINVLVANQDEAWDSSKEDQLEKEEKTQSGYKLRRLRCKARNACVVMGVFCVTNATLCNGRLVPEGCKGTNCQCCVPGTFELMVHNLESNLNSMKYNLSNDNSELQMELQEIKYNLTNDNTKLKLELQVMKNNMTQSNSNQESKLDYIIKRQGCPDGFFVFTPSRQCFKLYTDTKRSWTSAKSKCEHESLVLAKPKEPISLRKYLITNYGLTHDTWMDARGTGSVFKWQRNGQIISNSSPLWYHNMPGSSTSSSYCMLLLTYSSAMQRYPNQPYLPYSCTFSSWTLCEVVLE